MPLHMKNILRKFIFLFSALTFYVMADSELTSINITSLNSNGVEHWQVKSFSGESSYNISEYQGRIALKAESEDTASGLVLEQKIDLLKTPYINWSWLITNKIQPLNEKSKSGDDFVARIYIVIDGGLMLWKTKSLNYVWSSNQESGLVWKNPYAGNNVKMLSVKGQEAEVGKWYQEKRNVYQDLITIFGDQGSDSKNRKAYRYIDVIAIMTDTDNSGKKVESYYGDIVFTIN